MSQLGAHRSQKRNVAHAMATSPFLRQQFFSIIRNMEVGILLEFCARGFHHGAAVAYRTGDIFENIRTFPLSSAQLGIRLETGWRLGSRGIEGRSETSPRLLTQAPNSNNNSNINVLFALGSYFRLRSSLKFPWCRWRQQQTKKYHIVAQWETEGESKGEDASSVL